MSGSSAFNLRVALAAMVIPVAVGLAIWASGGLASLESDSIAGRFDIRGSRPAPPSVVMVVIDTEAIQRLRSVWGSPPYPRRLHALAIDRLRFSGVSAVGYDFSFVAPTLPSADRGPSDDLTLISAARKAGNVSFAFKSIRNGGDPLIFDWVSGGIARFRTIGEPGSIAYSGDGSRGGLAPGLIARVAGWDTLGLSAAKRAGAAARPAGSDAEDLALNYYGPPGTIDRVSFEDLVAPGGLDPALAAKLRGRVAMVGVDDPGSVGFDDPPKPTLAPGDGLMTGIEIHSTAAANALQGGYLVPLSKVLSVLLICVMGATVPLCAWVFRRPVAVALAAIALLAGFVAMSQALFSEGLVAPMVAPFVAFCFSLLAWLLVGYVRTEREQRLLRRRFAAFDQQLVDGVLGRTVASSRLTSDLVVPGFRLEAVIGRGAMGVVYRAEQLENGRMVAVKVLRPELADDASFVERFERETRLATLLDHPNVLPVFAAGDAGGVLFIATRLVEGGDLGAKLSASGPMSLERGTEIITGVGAALDAAHAQGLVHRDVKPANVLVDELGGHVYLTDFGIARQADEETLTVSGAMLGTLGYAAPEQIAGSEVGPAADVYGLGALLFALLSCEPPLPPTLSADLLAIRLAQWPPTLAAYPALDPVFQVALARDPDRRYSSASELVQAAKQATQYC